MSAELGLFSLILALIASLALVIDSFSWLAIKT